LFLKKAHLLVGRRTFVGERTHASTPETRMSIMFSSSRRQTTQARMPVLQRIFPPGDPAPHDICQALGFRWRLLDIVLADLIAVAHQRSAIRVQIQWSRMYWSSRRQKSRNHLSFTAATLELSAFITAVSDLT